MKKSFKIEYKDQDTQEKKHVVKEFEDYECGTLSITAKEWAEDYAYSLADKGWYSVTEVNK